MVLANELARILENGKPLAGPGAFIPLEPLPKNVDRGASLLEFRTTTVEALSRELGIPILYVRFDAVVSSLLKLRPICARFSIMRLKAVGSSYLMSLMLSAVPEMIT
nr:hypothetical protein [Heliobacterium chlorum]